MAATSSIYEIWMRPEVHLRSIQSCVIDVTDEFFTYTQTQTQLSLAGHRWWIRILSFFFFFFFFFNLPIKYILVYSSQLNSISHRENSFWLLQTLQQSTSPFLSAKYVHFILLIQMQGIFKIRHSPSPNTVIYFWF